MKKKVRRFLIYVDALHSCLPGYKDVSSANCAKSRLRSNNFITTVWWKAVFNAIGFFRRLRTPRGDLVGLGKGLSRLWSLLWGDKGKSSPAYLSTNRSAVLNAPDSLERAELTSAGKKSNYYLLKCQMLLLFLHPMLFGWFQRYKTLLPEGSLQVKCQLSNYDLFWMNFRHIFGNVRI